MILIFGSIALALANSTPKLKPSEKQFACIFALEDIRRTAKKEKVCDIAKTVEAVYQDDKGNQESIKFDCSEWCKK